jgi:diguanylate cyclase (GGDEF)-like protein
MFLSNFSLRTRIFAFFICLLVISTFNFGMMIYFENKSIQDFEQVTNTNNILILKGDLLDSIVNAESGQRGYLITSNKNYLTPFQNGKAKARWNLNKLRELTVNDPAQLEMLSILETLIDKKFSEMQMTIDSHFAGRKDESIALVNTNEGIELMERIRSILQSLNNDLIYKRDIQQKELITLQKNMRLIFIFESVFFAVVLFFLALIVSKTILQPINKIIISVKAFELNRKFIPVQINSRDELGLLAKTFNNMASKASLAASEMKGVIEKTEKQRDQALFESISDPLTGLSNRKFMEVELKKLMLSSKRYETALSIIILDLDHFKKINDTYGHVIGDLVLKKISELIKRTMRASDLTIRYGGEEFIIVMDHTASDEAMIKAETLREDVESLEIEELEGNSVTISLGVTQLCKEDDSINSFVARADEALYKAKTSGRNQCQLI